MQRLQEQGSRERDRAEGHAGLQRCGDWPSAEATGAPSQGKPSELGSMEAQAFQTCINETWMKDPPSKRTMTSKKESLSEGSFRKAKHWASALKESG